MITKSFLISYFMASITCMQHYMTFRYLHLDTCFVDPAHEM